MRDPLSRGELHALAERAGGVEALVSRRSPAYRARGGTAVDWLTAMVEEPRLIRRPILETPTGVVVGFDPAAWEKLLAQEDRKSVV